LQKFSPINFATDFHVTNFQKYYQKFHNALPKNAAATLSVTSMLQRCPSPHQSFLGYSGHMAEPM